MSIPPAAELDRLVALVERQRRELDRVRGEAASRSVLNLAQGVLMERLGCSAEEASRQLANLAEQAGVPPAEFAAEVAGEVLAAAPRLSVPASADPLPGGARPGLEPGDGPGWARLSLAQAAVATTEDGDQVAAAALEEALTPTGAAAVALWLLTPEGGLELAGEAGLGPREAGRWRYLPPIMDCLPQRVVRSGSEVVWPDGRPEGDESPVAAAWLTGARIALPMRWEGAVIGVLIAVWPEPLGTFKPALLRQARSLADLCAQALGVGRSGAGPAVAPRLSWLFGLLDGVIESALVAFPVRGGDGKVIDFRIAHVSTGFRDPSGREGADIAGRPLLEVYPLAALPGGLFDQAVKVLETGAPEHISGGVRSALVGGASVTPAMDTRIAPLFGGVVIATRRVDEAERLASLLQHAERLGRMGGWEENLLTSEVRWTESALALFGRRPGGAVPLAEMHTLVLPDDRFELNRFRDTLLREKRSSAAAFRITRADDQSLRQMRVFAEPVTDPAGDLAGVRGVFQDVSAQYHTQVALTATRDRLLDTQERAEEEHRLAVRLQQAITPWSSAPVAVAGLDIAARYRPAGPARLVSGDWYDTLLLPGEEMLLVVGDIAGHGIDAVTGMVEFRNVLRGLAITGAGPGSLLGWLNQHACHLTTGTIGTAVCGLYSPLTRQLRWARAGHLPPVLVRHGRAAELQAGGGLLLGADPAAVYEEVVTPLQPGDVLLLFTDGLVERRDQAIDDTVAGLLTLASRPVDSIASFADHLMREAGANTGDDACLVAVRTL